MSQLHTYVHSNGKGALYPCCDLHIGSLWFSLTQVMEKQMLEEMERKKAAQEQEEERKRVSDVCVCMCRLCCVCGGYSIRGDWNHLTIAN